MRNRATAAFSALVILIGLAIVARTIQAGVGGGLGLMIGGLFVAVGAGRLWLSVKGSH